MLINPKELQQKREFDIKQLKNQRVKTFYFENKEIIKTQNYNENPKVIYKLINPKELQQKREFDIKD